MMMRTEAKRFPRYLSNVDEHRARMLHVPKDSHVMIDVRETAGALGPGHQRSGVTKGLNKFMRQNTRKNFLLPCEDFSSEELDVVISMLEKYSHPKLEEIYKETCDTITTSNATRGVCDKRVRSNRKEIPEEPQFQQQQDDDDNDTTPPLWIEASRQVIRNGKCYDAVMLYYHHLDEASKHNIFVTEPNFKLPMLPENKDALHFLKSVLYVQQDREATTAARRRPRPHHRRHLQQDDKLFQEVGINPNQFFHDHNWSNLTDQQQLAYQEKLIQGLNSTYVQNLLDQYNTKSPCELAHATLSPQWSEETAIQAGIDPEDFDKVETGTFVTENVAQPGHIPNTETPGAGYVDCDQAAQCLDGGDVQYMVQAVVRTIKVPGSGKIGIPMTMENFGEDLLFHTRTFEGMPESPSAFGPDKAGGDGRNGLLGPALMAKPGQTMKLFVKNNFVDAQAYMGPDLDSAEDYWYVTHAQLFFWCFFGHPHTSCTFFLTVNSLF